ncbi:AAA family ATPase [Acidothermaceae bacterium B102]|nr:AAA family ATPase [Acidothermaceae bacterium B102]
MPNTLQLTAVLRQSPVEAGRGVVRLHPDALLALGAVPWSVLALTGARTTGALAALLDASQDPRWIACDELVLANLGVVAGATVSVTLAGEIAAGRVTLTAAAEVMRAVPPEAVRAVLLGKVVTGGDQVSLLAQDFHLPADVDDRDRMLLVTGVHRVLGPASTTALLTVVTVDPSGTVALVNGSTQVGWHGGTTTTSSTVAGIPAPPPRDAPDQMPVASVADELPSCAAELADLRGRLDLAFRRPDLLRQLGGVPALGVLVTGAPGSGKTAMVDAAARAVGARLVRVWGPGLVSAADAAAQLQRAAEQTMASLPSVFVVDDIDAAVPRDGQATLLGPLVDTIRMLLATGRVAVIGTSSKPQDVNPAVVAPGLLSHEIALALPSRDVRRRVLLQTTRSMPIAAEVDFDDIAGRTPGFVAADLVSLCREAAVRSAYRQQSGEVSAVSAADFIGALETVRPSSLQGDQLDLPDLSLDDVGNMVEVKQALTEAVLWPLSYPETFARLGVTPPRGVLLYGPPGCGKTFLVKALAGSGRTNVLSVKGAELLTKYVGESERGVRDLFRRARAAAPCLIFMDEIDALAPARGTHQDSATDGVVAALLTELDGIEELRDIVVVGATNRPDMVDPALLRPGRLERLVHVPAPDAAARTEILKACARKVPLAPDVDLAEVAAGCEGYSAADCAALLREAAMCAMRESSSATVVTLAHLRTAARTVPPSISATEAASTAAFRARGDS